MYLVPFGQVVTVKMISLLDSFQQQTLKTKVSKKSQKRSDHVNLEIPKQTI